jgi:nardilysin
MYLCLQSKLSLDELQDLALKYFSDIPCNLNAEIPLSKNPEFSYKNAFKKEFQKAFYVKPKSDLKKVVLNWLLPPMLDKYRCKPHHYISHILGYEGPGSFCSYLRKKLLAIDVIAGSYDCSYHSNSIFMLFTISITLTDYGYQNLDKVLEAVFSYLLLLQKSKPSEHLFNEYKQIKDTYFRFRAESGSTARVISSCKNLKYYPAKDVLSGPELLFEYNEKEIRTVIDALNQPNFNYIVLANDHNFDKVEEFFGTEYRESGKKLFFY